eukprot:EG_transcript_55485
MHHRIVASCPTCAENPTVNTQPAPHLYSTQPFPPPSPAGRHRPRSEELAEVFRVVQADSLRRRHCVRPPAQWTLSLAVQLHLEDLVQHIGVGPQQVLKVLQRLLQ